MVTFLLNKGGLLSTFIVIFLSLIPTSLPFQMVSQVFISKLQGKPQPCQGIERRRHANKIVALFSDRDIKSFRLRTGSKLLAKRKSNQEDQDPLVQSILSRAENPFLRRARELRQSNKTLTENISSRNQTVGAAVPSLKRERRSRESAYNLPDKSTWRSPHDAFGAMFSEITALTNDIER